MFSALNVVFAFGIVLLVGAFETNAPSAAVAATSDLRAISFRTDVNPVLQRNCSVCHSAGGIGYVKSGFSVKNYRAVMKGTRFGPAVIPGSSISSNLVLLLKHGASPSINMPRTYHAIPAGHDKGVGMDQQAQQLDPHDVWLISTWIDQGAKNN
jgi:hypothetical protein